MELRGRNITKTRGRPRYLDRERSKSVVDHRILSIGKQQLPHVKDATTSKEAYDALVKIHERSSPVQLSLWYRQLSHLKKDNNASMQSHLNVFQGLVNKLKDAKIDIPESLLVIMLLETLPEEYRAFITAIETRDALPTAEISRLQTTVQIRINVLMREQIRFNLLSLKMYRVKIISAIDATVHIASIVINTGT